MKILSKKKKKNGNEMSENAGNSLNLMEIVVQGHGWKKFHVTKDNFSTNRLMLACFDQWEFENGFGSRCIFVGWHNDADPGRCST